jgi:hypothetical protein
MRLIDADALYDEIEYDALFSVQTAKDIVELIFSAPTVEAVEVVRCKDCDNYTPTESGKLGYCCISDNIWFANDFCNHGRCREGD